jgi:hypothetical protein
MNLQFRAIWVLLGSLIATAYAHAAPGLPQSHHVQQASRIEVLFPPLVKRQTLATMRMHLQGLAEIQGALAVGKFEKAAQIAMQSLGMSSMHGNQMAEEAKYMPHGMKKLGALMHQRAAAFAISAQNAAATGDIRPPLRALSRVTETCVACHAVYRLK